MIEITKPDDLITNALAGVDSIYYVAQFYDATVYRAAPERVSLSAACFVESAKQKSDDTPTNIMRREVMRLYGEGLVSPVQHRIDVDGIVTIRYIAQSTRRREVAQ